MKKFLISIFIFLIFSGVFYILALFLWGSYAPTIFKPNIHYRIASYGHLYSRLAEVKNTKNIDLLFLGSSHAYRGFDTRIFSQYGMNSFNLGSSAQTPIQTSVLLKRYLDSLNPKTVIYEVYPEIFMIDGVESSLDLIANDRNDVYSLKMALKINNIRTYNTLLFGIIRDFFNLNRNVIEHEVKENDRYISGGFVEKDRGYMVYEPVVAKEISLDDQQLELFSEIVSIFQSRNIDLLLVYAPIPNNTYNSYSNNSYFDSLMSSYAEYYNFNEIMELNDTIHFYDAHHLNQFGVGLFNMKLIELLNDR